MSEQSGALANLRIDPAETSVAESQASRFSQVCRVFASVYPQLTLSAILKPADLTAANKATAFAGVVSAWDDYLAHDNDGRGVVVIWGTWCPWSVMKATPTGAEMPPARAFRQLRFEAPPGATEILLVRHGESEPAVDGRPFPLIDGQGDPALSPVGRTQARLVCARLSSQEIDAIYVTTLRRTVETAAGLAEALGLPCTVEADLREVFVGEWEGGLLRRMMVEMGPTARRVTEEQRWDVIPGAEPADDFSRRVRGALERIAAAHADERVVVFTHGGTIGELLAQATGSEPFAFTGSDNASISHLVITPQRWILRRFNDTAHLDDLSPHGLELHQ